MRWVKAVPDDFHARFSATARRYRYIIYDHRLRPAVLSKGIDFYEPLDAERMHRAAQCLLGENDFTSFRAVQCQSEPSGVTLCILMSRVTVLMWW